MPVGSSVVITYDGTDITSHVIFSTATFESQLNAVPGTFEFTCKDEARTLSFVTGKEVTLTIDGQKMFGGYVTLVTRKFAFPVDDTTRQVRTRQWTLRGVDYNILFDKRILHHQSALDVQLPNFPAGSKDGDLIKEMCANYLDLPAGFDTTTYVDNVTTVNPDAEGAWLQQGSTWRQQMADFAAFSGAVWYIDANKNLIFRSLEDSLAPWGFSDVPNKISLNGKPANTLSTWGFREIDIVEDGSFIINDAFVWGGSEFAGDGGTVFARAQNAGAISQYGRWQYAEARFGQPLFKSQQGVETRANVIVNGPPGAVDGDQNRGLRYPHWQIKLAWFGHDVPDIGGTRQHLVAGHLTTHVLFVQGSSNSNPLIQTLPLRQVRISFPELDQIGDGYVRFEGFWALLPSDPYSLWGFLLGAKTTLRSQAIATANSGSNTTTYGAFGQFAPLPEPPNGTTYVFKLPNGIGYISGTTQVYVNGILQRLNAEYSESNPDAGEITFSEPPLATDRLWVVCRTTGS